MKSSTREIMTKHSKIKEHSVTIAKRTMCDLAEEVRSGAKVCKSCRSFWKMLYNEYLIAKIGFDTTEKERPNVSMKWGIGSICPICSAKRAIAAGTSGRLPGPIRTLKAVEYRSKWCDEMRMWKVKAHTPISNPSKFRIIRKQLNLEVEGACLYERWPWCEIEFAWTALYRNVFNAWKQRLTMLVCYELSK